MQTPVAMSCAWTAWDWANWALPAMAGEVDKSDKALHQITQKCALIESFTCSCTGSHTSSETWILFWSCTSCLLFEWFYVATNCYPSPVIQADGTLWWHCGLLHSLKQVCFSGSQENVMHCWWPNGTGMHLLEVVWPSDLGLPWINTLHTRVCLLMSTHVISINICISSAV